jgi:hypothetical protein
MRDFRDAKAMATSLRQALSDKSVSLTHSESLELVAKSFGLDNWNILAAKIETERPAPLQAEAVETPTRSVLYCSFCGKSQHDVLQLIAGPSVFICNECVGLCDGIVADGKLKRDLAAAGAARPDAPPLEVAAEVLEGLGAGQLDSIRKSNADWLEHIDWSLKQIDAAAAGQARTPWRPDEVALRRGWTRDPLAGKTPEEIAAQRKHLQELRAGVSERLRLIAEVVEGRTS